MFEGPTVGKTPSLQLLLYSCFGLCLFFRVQHKTRPLLFNCCSSCVIGGFTFEGPALGQGAHKIIGATRPILRVLFGVLFGIFMEYSTQ
jgi:hypothetical protein